jgi:cytochrome b subunit of formate dehydrogenase
MKSLLQAISLAVALLGGTAAANAQAANLDNATCLGCHGKPGFATTAPHARSLFVPAEQLAHSVHASTACVECHTAITEIPHKIATLPAAERRRRLRLANTKACGNCHAKAIASYKLTYHGTLYTLGYTHIATCADCHGEHAILPVGSPASRVSAAKRLDICRKCHANASAGFASYEPHATRDDFARYPYNWIASKFVWMLIIVTFGIFWTHSALWLYSELRDRRERRLRPQVRAKAVPPAPARYVERWSAAWRWAHLGFAGSVIVLIMTGISLLYPDSAWAPVLIRILGGPQIAGIVHRTAGIVMITVFAAHLVYVAIHLWRNWNNVRLFGPYSLLPTWQDGYDVIAMLKWFSGRGPRPVFDHWSYQQKFDYWAPFWGVSMLAATGAMMWFKILTGTVLPGWSLNLAMVVHGDEAVLAAGYLFTIHFFANHWRPDKFPLDIVIFTGSMPLEEFKREYGVEYERLKKTGELGNYLVEAPSPPMRLGSKILGFALVAIGLALLVMMVIGFGGTL